MADKSAETPRNVRWEIARLAQFSPIVDGSIKFAKNRNGIVGICFEIETDIHLEATDSPIGDIEPIIFQYSSVEQVGKVAPRVLSARADFPRTLPHINPGPRTQPVSLCVARAGHQAIYDANGVVGIVDRTLKWLNDAKVGCLHEDGWDPVPNDTFDDGVIGYVDAAKLQSHASSLPNGDIAFSAATITHMKNKGVFLHAELGTIDTTNLEELGGAKIALKMCNKDPCEFKTHIPVVFAWPERSRIEHDSHFNEWQDMQSLVDGLHATALHEKIDTAFIKLDPLFDEDQDLDMNGHRSILLIIGLWRPVALDSTIVGLATDPDARCLELRCFYLERDSGNADRWSLDTNVRPFVGLVSTLPETLEAVSGEPALNHTALLGAGALGSAFFAYIVRAGGNHITIADDDLLMSHNMARHRAPRSDVGKNKAELAPALASEWAQDVHIVPAASDIASMTDEELGDLFGSCERVWDATANPLVRRKLSAIPAPTVALARSEIYHGGQLGVTLLTTIGSEQNLNHLFQQLVALAFHNDWIKEWLAYESSRSFTDEELILGFGCRSMTTMMPAYKVESHASAAFAVAKQHTRQANAKIALHRTDHSGVSQGVHLFEADNVVAFSSSNTGGWTVLVAQSVLDKLRTLRRDAVPDETGGYLFGAIDEDLSQIHIVAASPEPPGSVASPSALQLGPWGQTGFEKAFMRRTQHRLPPIGTWHSHPGSSPTASGKDRKTVESFKLDDAMKGLPTVMGISGETADAFYVLEP